MLNYLEKFSQLPPALKSRASSPEVVAVMNELEKTYHTSLGTLVMRLLVADIDPSGLEAYFINEAKLAPEAANELAKEVRVKVLDLIDGAAARKAVNAASNTMKTDGGLNSNKTFFFSPNDQKEISDLAKKVDEYLKVPQSGVEMDVVVQQVITESKINLASQALKERFQNIVKTYLRGIRNGTETKIALTKQISLGGMALEEVEASKILALIDKAAASKKTSKTRTAIDSQSQELMNVGARDIEYDLAKEIAKRAASTNRDQNPVDSNDKAGTMTQPVAAAPAISPEIKMASNKTENHQSIFLVEQSRLRQNGADPKIKIEDVKTMPKIMGPLEELRYLDATNFRRLHPDPMQTILKVKGKVDLLEGESYNKRMMGVRSWRQSPIFQLYLEIYLEALERNKTAAEIVEAREDAAVNYLSAKEISAIISLNRIFVN